MAEERKFSTLSEEEQHLVKNTYLAQPKLGLRQVARLFEVSYHTLEYHARNAKWTEIKEKRERAEAEAPVAAVNHLRAVQVDVYSTLLSGLLSRAQTLREALEWENANKAYGQAVSDRDLQGFLRALQGISELISQSGVTELLQSVNEVASAFATTSSRGPMESSVREISDPGDRERLMAALQVAESLLDAPLPPGQISEIQAEASRRPTPDATKGERAG